MNSSRYEEDEDYHEPGKKKSLRGGGGGGGSSVTNGSNASSDKKKSKHQRKSSSKHHDSDEELAIDESNQDDSVRSVPPLKIKLPPREKSKRSSKRSKNDSTIDDSMFGTDDDEFTDGNSVSNISTRKSKSSSTPAPSEETSAPTRRSERIFVSNAKKTAPTNEEEEEEYVQPKSEVIDFKIIHKDYCQGCRQGGELILCDYCPRAYHKVCTDEEIDEIPDDWCCPHCQKNGKPDPKELREQQVALLAKKKKKQQGKEQLSTANSASAAASGSKISNSATSSTKAKSKVIENRDYCEICNQVGELLLCDTCPRAYHLVCMDQQTIPSGNWSCPHCEEHGFEIQPDPSPAPEEKVEKAEKIVCKGCRQTGGEIIFCGTCPARYHIYCMNPPLDEVPESWHCLSCSVEPLKGKVQRIITWRWKKLVQEQESEKNLSAEDDTKNLLKNLKNRKPREREYFVKWKDMSYWHCSWVDEAQMQVFHNGMHRFFTQKNDMTTPPVFDEIGTITTDVPHEEVPKEDSNEPQTEYHRGISASIAVKHRRRKRASVLPQEVEEQYVRYGIRPEWLLIHRIVNHRKSRGKLYYVIKWRDLAYEEVTVEPEPENCDFEIPDYQKKIDDYWNLKRLVEEETATEEQSSSKKRDKDKGKSKDKKKKHPFGSGPKVDPKKKYEVQPDFIPEPLKLHEYQKEGINWLRFSWSSGIDTILADEMGLGKTIQTVAFLYSLYKEGHTRGPFLIAAPLSTIINWERELEDWCPDFYVVNYTGNKDSRIIIRENELSFDADAIRSSAKAMKLKKSVPVKFHVLLTSYELINADSALLGSIDWKVLVVDEAHRLKSNQSLFFRTLNQYNVGHKLLLTGTPLQNNLEELFNLLNFLSPDRFSDMEGFLSEFSDIAKEEQVKKLHELLGSHLLRRLKQDVLTGMPSKSEFIVRVDLAPVQKKYYKYILTRNFGALNTKGGGKQVSLLNIVMDLKKCCNHPYLFPVAAEEAPKTKLGYFEGSALTKACGKLVVLQKMLRKLKEDNHRVLIFSQMTQMLDVLEDFLEAEGYKYERIDGSITGSVRQEAIDRFNAPGAQQFVFLLSTRAGGLGINLATADTVVIYDSDWNPHNDIQALSRAHRIGQTNKVMIYRFVTRNSVEERITQVAKKKMMLTHLVVRPGLGSKTTNTTMSKQELDDILKFGTEELFKEEEGKESETAIHYDDKAIEGLLDRTQEGIEQKELWANEYLSSFKVASYVTKEAEEEEEEVEEPVQSKPVKDESANDPHYWEKLLGAHYVQYQENISRSLGKGKRVRKQVNYMDSVSGQNEYHNPDTSESSDFSMPSDVSENDDDFDERMEGRVGNQKSARKITKEKMPPLLSAIGPNTEVIGFTPKHRKLFLDLVMRFGLPNLEQSLTDSQFYIRELKSKPEKHLRAYASLFISHLCEPGDPSQPTFEDGVPKEGLNVGQVLARIGIISLIKRKVFEFQNKHGLVSYTAPRKPAPPKPVESQSLLQPIQNGSNEATSDSTDAKNSIKKDDGGDEIKQEVKGEPMEVDGEEKNVKVIDDEKKSDVSNNDKSVKDENKEDNAKVKSEEMEVDDNKPDQEEKKIKDDDTKDSEIDESSQQSTVKSETETKDSNSSTTNGTPETVKEEEVVEEKESEPATVKEFEFTIQDAGLTELHTLWYFEDKELKPKHEHEIWNRRHDYWMLAGICKYGYERWDLITDDTHFAILNEPFRTSIGLRNKFMERRLKLLEQALVFEEHIRRYSSLSSAEQFIEKPKEEPKVENGDNKDDVEMEDESKQSKPSKTEKDENTNGDMDDKENGEMILNPSIQRVANQIEDLLIDMKSDCARIPQTVQRIPSIATRLQIGPSSGASGRNSSNAPLGGIPQMMNRMM